MDKESKEEKITLQHVLVDYVLHTTNTVQPYIQVMHEYDDLANFWKRYNKSLLDKLSLGKLFIFVTDAKPLLHYYQA